MKIHVICCNDSVEYAVVDNENLAKQILEELRLKYYDRNKWSLGTWRDYELRCFWHIHTVEGS